MQLAGVIDHIIYFKEESSYTVLILNATDGEAYTCVGELPGLSPGEAVIFEGDLAINPKYGVQFQVSGFSFSAMDDEASVLRYLSSGFVKGIGPGLARRIVDRFGQETFRIMEEEPERLAEIKGISLRMAVSMARSFEERAGSRQAISFLMQYNISPNLGKKIYDRYKDEVYEIIRSNPYRLIEDIDGVGFETADRLAERTGIARDSEYRIRSAVIYLLSSALAQGSVCLTREELMERALEILDVDRDLILRQLDNLSVERKIIREEEEGTSYIYGENAYYTEAEIARLLFDLNLGAAKDEKKAYEAVLNLEKQERITLEDMQREAVVGAICDTVSVITGGPGTGKTTITNLIIRYFESLGMDITLAAPTGRAAKRLSEATGCEAKTIHRLLGAGAVAEDTGRAYFMHDRENPLETDVIIVDEMSMVDMFVFRAMIRAIVPGTRLILVGDSDQLPSVGPGAVLRDIIGAGCFRVTKLNRIYRQSEASAIVRNAHLIIEGRDVDLDEKSSDFFFLERSDPERIIMGMIYLAQKKLSGHLGCDPLEIQIMTPMRKGVLGVENLNVRLQEAMNPPDPKKREIATPNGIIRAGDKVMQIKNDYEMPWEISNKRGMVCETGTGVFNGDIGKVLSVSLDSCYVRFDDDREAVYKGDAVSELELAYAITVHKSQGSEYKGVIIPLLGGPKMLMNRNLLYTAVTRAKELVCIMGSKQAVKEMISNEREEKRYTGLQRRLLEIMGT